MFSMVYKGQRRKIKIRTPWISTLSHEIHTEMKKLVFPAIKIDSLNLSPSLVIPHPSISLDSFSHTLLFIISFPSTYFSWFTLGFWNHLHVLLLNPLRFPHHLLLQILTSFPYHLLLLTPLPSWVPPSLTFADSPPPPMGSPVTYFYWFPLGFPDHLLLLIPPWAPPRWHLACPVQGMLWQLSSFLLPQRQICCWMQVSDWLPLTEVLGSLTYTCRGTAIEESIPIEQAVKKKKMNEFLGRKEITATSEGVFASNTVCHTYLHWILW